MNENFPLYSRIVFDKHLKQYDQVRRQFRIYINMQYSFIFYIYRRITIGILLITLSDTYQNKE